MTTESGAMPSIGELADTKFSATIEGKIKVRNFKALMDGAGALLTEFFFMVNDSGIRLRQLDSSKAALVDFEIDAEFFEDYLFESNHAEVMLCVPADVVTRIMKKATTKCDKIELDLIKRDKDTSRFGVAVHSDVTLREKIGLLRPAEDMTKKPNLTSKGICHVVACELQEYIKQAAKAKISGLKFSLRDRVQYAESEHGEAIQYPRGLTIEGENFETEIFYELAYEDSVWNIWVEAGQTQTVMAAGEYLTEGVKLFVKDDEIKVHITTDRPIIFETNSSDGRKITYIQAPRVERRGR